MSTTTKIMILRRFINVARAFDLPYYITDQDMSALERDIKKLNDDDPSYQKYQLDLLINDPLRKLFRDDAVSSSALYLDHNSAYGGYRIDKFSGAGCDFFDDSQRRSGASFYDYLGTLIRSVGLYKRLKGA